MLPMGHGMSMHKAWLCESFTMETFTSYVTPSQLIILIRTLRHKPRSLLDANDLQPLGHAAALLALKTHFFDFGSCVRLSLTETLTKTSDEVHKNKSNTSQGTFAARRLLASADWKLQLC